MKRLSIFLHTVAILIVCLNAGFQSTAQDEAPAINFFGTVTVNDETTQAFNILVSGLYENIKMYDIPSSPEIIPTTNATTFAFDDIKALRRSEDPLSIKTFNNRDYVEIIVERKDGTAKKYLVERSRKLYYDVPLADPKLEPLKKEVAIEAVQKILFEGHKAKERKSEKKGIITQSAAQEALCVQAKKDLATLEQQANATGFVQKIINNLKETILYLCG